MKIGPHVSISKGLDGAVKEGKKHGASAIQIFTRSPRGGPVKPIENLRISEGQELAKEYGIQEIVVHAPYIINLAAKKHDTWETAKEVLAADIVRAEAIGAKGVVVHPGLHVGEGVEYGISRIAEALNEILTGEEKVQILLETVSGKGSEIGKNFEEIVSIIEKVKYSEQVGVCGDTCHLYAAGYDIVNEWERILERFDSLIGIDKLRAFHINDSMMPYNSRKDRHENIGEGYIGLEVLRRVVNDSLLEDIPKILETPRERYKEEIEMLIKI